MWPIRLSNDKFQLTERKLFWGAHSFRINPVYSRKMGNKVESLGLHVVNPKVFCDHFKKIETINYGKHVYLRLIQLRVIPAADIIQFLMILYKAKLTVVLFVGASFPSVLLINDENIEELSYSRFKLIRLKPDIRYVFTDEYLFYTLSQLA